MNLKNYVDMIIKLKVEPRKSDFLCSIVEAFIRDPFTTEIVENPLLKYENNNTLRAICNGNKSLSKTCASELSNLYDKDKMMNFFYNRTNDFEDFKQTILKFGFEIERNEENDEDIPATLADLLAKIFIDISNGFKETYPPLKKVNIHSLDKDAFKDLYISEEFLHINGQAIALPEHFMDVTSKNTDDLLYVTELFKVYSELSGKDIKSVADLKLYPKFIEHFIEQKRCYYKAEAACTLAKILFSDGDKHFDILKDEIFSSVYETFFDLSLKGGYQRLKNVLEMVVKANLNNSLLLKISGFITAKEKKGICHILINERRLKSWTK